MIEIKGTSFEVEILRKKIRNLYIRVNDGKIEVTAPKYVSDREIYAFIHEKEEWIYNTNLKTMIHEFYSKIYHGGKTFYLFDKPFTIHFETGKDNVTITDRDIFLTYHSEDREKAIAYLYKHLDKRVYNCGCLSLDKYQQILYDYGYHHIPEVTVKKMKSKWGVCYTRDNRIALSSYLIHFPTECIDYIVLHEIVHFIMPNHSKRFYQIVSNYMPNYKEISSLLK